MVQSYLRYEPSGTFGSIFSGNGSVIYDKSGHLAIVPALQSVAFWNLKQGLLVKNVSVPSLISSLALNMAGTTVAVGCMDGSIHIFSVESGEMVMNLEGHKKAVECLAWNEDGNTLASGGKDTDVIVWDMVLQKGIFRLRGHRDGVTSVVFTSSEVLVSSSKDTLVKVWDLTTQHCVQTVVGHRSEVWDVALNADKTQMVTVSSDNLLRVYAVQQSNNEETLTALGSFVRDTSDRATVVGYNANGTLLACLSGKNVEVYAVRSHDAMLKKAARRVKRLREKANKKRTADDMMLETPTEETPAEGSVNVTDTFAHLCTYKSTHKVRSFAFNNSKSTNTVTASSSSQPILLGFNNNSIESFMIEKSSDKKSATFVTQYGITLPGHRSDIRQVQLCSENNLLLTLSHDEAKIWNTATMKCIRTITSPTTSTCTFLSCSFAPGNKHIILGSKQGSLQIFDLSSGALTFEDSAAHTGAIWSMDVRKDGTGIATGSADHDVKFWDFDLLKTDTTATIRTLSLVHTKTLKMADDVLCVKYSHSKVPSKALIAIALLDCTVKVFFEDSLKFFLSLYGHKLPVLSMSMSDDDTLLATASADKNVKLWGLDFGDCHKSLLVHTDSVMHVAFIPGTHYFITCSKDTTLRYYDGDTFERILSLSGHSGHVWAFIVSSDGGTLYSVSADKSIRKWNRSEDQVFLEEEREKELEGLFESELNHGKKNNGDLESAPVKTATVATVKAGERLMEALDLADAERNMQAAFEKEVTEMKENSANKAGVSKKGPPSNVLLLGHTPLKYMIRTLRGIKSNEMEEALMVLPLDYVTRLITWLINAVKMGLEVETTLNALLFLLRVHQEAIVAMRHLVTELDAMWTLLRNSIGTSKDAVGYNLAACKFLQHRIETSKTVSLS